MFYLCDASGFILGKFATREKAYEEMAAYGNAAEDLFVSDDPNPWGEGEDLEDDEVWEDDLEMGFDPYMGCYSWDC